MIVTTDNRKRPRDLDREEFKKCIRIIKKDFTRSWLEDYNGFDHPLKTLWSRTDKFASVQLFQLGYSLRKIKQINKKWYDRVVKEIKNEDIGQMRANILEIFVASQLHNPPDRIVELPGRNNPGWDLKVKLSNGLEIFVQVKNNSVVENFENEKVHDIEKIIESNLRSGFLKVCISKTDNKDPSDIEWHKLKERLRDIMQGPFKESYIESDVEGGWHIRMTDIGNSIPNLHPTKKSYEMLLTTPFSKSEKDKIFRCVINACSDLGKKRETDTEESINIALVYVPLDASFSLCSELTHQYFEDTPEPRASGVLFYKSGATTDTEKNQNFLAHAFHLVLRDSKRCWLETSGFPTSIVPLFKKIDIGIGRGSFSIDGINEEDIYNLIDAGSEKTYLKSDHVYQSGQINYLLRHNGTYNFNRHTGIKIHFWYIDSDGQEKEEMDYIGDEKPILLSFQSES